MMRPAGDNFEGLARYYDALMGHVNYERWYIITTELASLLPSGFRHLDAACGTGVLLEKLSALGWHTSGLDVSGSMLTEARRRCRCPLIRGDLRQMPFTAARVRDAEVLG